MSQWQANENETWERERERERKKGEWMAEWSRGGCKLKSTQQNRMIR